MSEIKVGQVELDPDRTISAIFEMAVDEGSKQIKATVLGQERQLPEVEYITAVQRESDEVGNSWDRYLKLPRSLMESKKIVVEFYDSHEDLAKGIGGVAVVGSIVVGTLFFRRRFHRPER